MKPIIEEDVEIGENPEFGYYNVIKSGARIGNNFSMRDYATTTGLVLIGDNVNVRTTTMVSRGVILEDNVILGGAITTSHMPDIRRGTQYITRIGYGSVIGSGTNIKAGVFIAPNVVIGMGSLVLKDITESGIYVGNPLRYLKPNPYLIEGKTMRNFTKEEVLKYLPKIKLGTRGVDWE